MLKFVSLLTMTSDLWRSNALTVPSKDELTTTLPEALKHTPVTPDACSEKVTKQNPEVVCQSFTCASKKRTKGNTDMPEGGPLTTAG